MKREFIPFAMERMMSVWENIVDYNLSESGVHPLTVSELVEDPQMIEELLSVGLNYAQANGLLELREEISALYPSATPESVLVTVGCAQANFSAVQTLLNAGDEIVIMLPNYMQIWGLAHNFGLEVKTFSLKEELGWGIDVDELKQTVTNKTKLIAICNPNNPTGHIMADEEREAVLSVASKVGAWLLVDEVYSGAERVTNEFTPTFYGSYDRVIVTNSLSKAYGLPGLRLGWIVGPDDTIDDIWARHEYTTISATMLSNKLAAYALSPEVRPKLLARTRSYIREGYKHLERWIAKHPGLFSCVPPEAAAIAYIRYNLEVNSSELVNRLLHEQSTYVVPGDHFGMDYYLRVSFGLPEDYLNAGLERISEVIASY